MKNTLSTITAAVALLGAAPSAHAEKITDDQRACVEQVLNTPTADVDAVRQCMGASAAEAVGEDPDKKPELAPNAPEAQALFTTLQARMSKVPEHYRRAGGVNFTDVKKALETRPDLLWSLKEMEKTGGEPDVIAVEGNTYVFADVSKESPEGRRYLNYDEAKAMADTMGVKMMDPATWRTLDVDHTSWTWLLTDAQTRATGRALYGARVGDDVNVYLYYADNRDSREGWRGLLRVPRT